MVRPRSGSLDPTRVAAISQLVFIAAIAYPRPPQTLTFAGLLVVLSVIATGSMVLHLWRRSHGPGSKRIADDQVRVIALNEGAFDRSLRDAPRIIQLGNATPRPVSQAPRVRDLGLPGPGTQGLAIEAEPTLPVRRIVVSAEAEPSGSLADRVHAIDGFQFKHLLASGFRKQGFLIHGTAAVGSDEGIDLVIERSGRRTAVRCKHWKAWVVNPRTVRELHAAMSAAGIRTGILLTVRGCTPDAAAKAKECGIQLWTEPDILNFLRSVGAEEDPELRTWFDDRRRYCPRCESELIQRAAGPGDGAHVTTWECSRRPACSFTLEESGQTGHP